MSKCERVNYPGAAGRTGKPGGETAIYAARNHIVPQPQPAYKVAMNFFLKWCLKILWWFTFTALALIIIALVYRDWIAGQVMEKQIRDALGVDAEIGNLSFSVLEPKMTFDNFKIYNSADFGGTLFVDTPELHIEYDRNALRHHEIHITFMRVNINELDVVKNEQGATNIFSIAKIVVPIKSGSGRTFAPLKGYQFTGIDFLNISIGTAKFIDLKNHFRNRSLALGIQNQTFTNVESPADLAGLKSLIWVHGGYLVGLPGSPPKHSNPIGINTTNAIKTP
jgi:hypothetical protein